MRAIGTRIWLLSALLACGSLTRLASGAEHTIEVTISAGARDRKNVPICIPLSSRLITTIDASVTLTGADGNRIPAQLTQPSLLADQETRGEIHFILPELSAGKSLSLKATLSTEAPLSVPGFTWHDQAGDFTVLQFGTRPVLRYHYRALDETSAESRERTYKVFHHLFSPRGDVLTTGGLSNDPDVHSPHHRGIFFGFNRISYGNGQRADVWHCIDGAYQAHDQFLATESGSVLGRHRVSIRWHGQDKKAFAIEQRELTAYNIPGGQLVEFASQIRPTSGPVKLDGDPQHAGLHFRAHNEVYAKTSAQTIYVRPDGVGKPGETRNWDPSTRQGPVNLPWNAMSFVLGSTRYTVAYLDHTRNPKEARQSEREYGRFGTCFEYLVETDRPLKVNYRFWLQEGMPAPEQIAGLSRDFVEPLAVTSNPVR